MVLSRKDCVNFIDENMMDLFDLMIYLKYSPSSDYGKIKDMFDVIKKTRSELQENINPVLVGLKEYTEGSASWERAGRISDLHIFGLRKYCDEHGVDWRNLRIDEYYGITDAQLIKEEWEKLDKSHEYSPIDFTGGHYMFRSDLENMERNAFETFYSKKGQVLVASFVGNIFKVFDILNKVEGNVEEYISLFKEDVRILKRVSEMLWITKQEDYERLLEVSVEATETLLSAIRELDIEKVYDAINLLESNISVGCYFATVKNKDKIKE